MELGIADQCQLSCTQRSLTKLQQGFGVVAQAGEKKVPVEGGLCHDACQTDESSQSSYCRRSLVE